MALPTDECDSLDAMCREVGLMHRLTQAVHEAVVHHKEGKIIPLLQHKSVPPLAEIRSVAKG
jgi:hypothetical protein